MAAQPEHAPGVVSKGGPLTGYIVYMFYSTASMKSFKKYITKPLLHQTFTMNMRHFKVFFKRSAHF